MNSLFTSLTVNTDKTVADKIFTIAKNLYIVTYTVNEPDLIIFYYKVM